MKTSKDNVLKSIYYDEENPSSYGGVKKLYISAKKLNPEITLNDVQKWLSSQITYTIHKPVIRKFKRNPVLVSRVGEEWMADLTDMSQVANHNDGVKYLMCVIDVLSKHSWVELVKNKRPETIIKAFENIFKDIHKRKPEKLQTDKGTEFKNKTFQAFMKKHDIKYFVSQNEETKCSVVERFHRTLKDKIYRFFTANGTKRYIDDLQKIVASYNSTKHSSTKYRPVDVNASNEKDVFKNLYKGESSLRSLIIKRLKEGKLKTGETVRLSKHADKFKRGFTPNWTEEVFNIDKVITRTVTPVYELKDKKGEAIVGRSYPKELQKITEPTHYRIEKILRKRKRGKNIELLVKWLGYPDSFNEWISSKEVKAINK
jgi:transposase InsO family protein